MLEVVRRAVDLEADDWDGALDLLVDANRSDRSDEIEIALAALRRRGWEHLDSTRSRSGGLVEPHAG